MAIAPDPFEVKRAPDITPVSPSLTALSGHIASAATSPHYAAPALCQGPVTVPTVLDSLTARRRVGAELSTAPMFLPPAVASAIGAKVPGFVPWEADSLFYPTIPSTLGRRRVMESGNLLVADLGGDARTEAVLIGKTGDSTIVVIGLACVPSGIDVSVLVRLSRDGIMQPSMPNPDRMVLNRGLSLVNAAGLSPFGIKIASVPLWARFQQGECGAPGIEWRRVGGRWASRRSRCEAE